MKTFPSFCHSEKSPKQEKQENYKKITFFRKVLTAFWEKHSSACHLFYQCMWKPFMNCYGNGSKDDMILDISMEMYDALYNDYKRWENFKYLIRCIEKYSIQDVWAYWAKHRDTPKAIIESVFQTTYHHGRYPLWKFVYHLAEDHLCDCWQYEDCDDCPHKIKENCNFTPYKFE